MATPEQPAWRGVIVVLVVAGLGATLAAWVASRTGPRIADNRAAQIMQRLEPLLPADGYYNLPYRDTIEVADAELLGSADPQTIYRARSQGQPIAAVMTVTAPDGYVAPIRLLVAVSADGRILGVRALDHEETAGLGDKIDLRHSDWIHVFAGKSLGEPERGQWTVAANDGSFDEISGATITSRAVVHAVRDALLYFEQHRDKILAASTGDPSDR